MLLLLCADLCCRSFALPHADLYFALCLLAYTIIEFFQQFNFFCTELSLLLSCSIRRVQEIIIRIESIHLLKTTTLCCWFTISIDLLAALLWKRAVKIKMKEIEIKKWNRIEWLMISPSCHQSIGVWYFALRSSLSLSLARCYCCCCCFLPFHFILVPFLSFGLENFREKIITKALTFYEERLKYRRSLPSVFLCKVCLL